MNERGMQVVDQAFGPHADLYVDVLRVSCLATQQEVQDAFFLRRSELFHLLGKLETTSQDPNIVEQRLRLERRMDATVVAFRVLDDQEQRMYYDEARHERLQKRSEEDDFSSSGIDRLQVSTLHPHPAVSRQTEEPPPQQSSSRAITPSPPSSSRKARREARQSEKYRYSWKTDKANKSNSSRGSPTPSNTSLLDSQEEPSDSAQQENATTSSSTRAIQATFIEETDDDDDDDTALTDKTPEQNSRQNQRTAETTSKTKLKTSSTSKRRVSKSKRHPHSSSSERSLAKKSPVSSMLRSVVDEIRGSVDDTTAAFDQVCHAFTLGEKDIAAVTARIDKAKRQFQK